MRQEDNSIITLCPNKIGRAVQRNAETDLSK